MLHVSKLNKFDFESLKKERIKVYPFTQRGFNKVRIDIKGDKIGKKMDLVFWGVVGCLVIGGVMATGTATTMVACTLTSKTVKYLMR